MPLEKNWVQYFIWKLSLVVLNPEVGIGMTALFHITALFEKLPILLHKPAKWRFIVKVAVAIMHRGAILDVTCIHQEAIWAVQGSLSQGAILVWTNSVGQTLCSKAFNQHDRKDSVSRRNSIPNDNCFQSNSFSMVYVNHNS